MEWNVMQCNTCMCTRKPLEQENGEDEEMSTRFFQDALSSCLAKIEAYPRNGGCLMENPTKNNGLGRLQYFIQVNGHLGLISRG